MADTKTTNWTEAIARAKKHPSGQFSMTHTQTLKALERAGKAEKLSDGLYYLTDKGWGEDAPKQVSAEPVVEEQPEQPYKITDPQRLAFDTAFNVLLNRENLNGTEWAIKRIQEEADRMPDKHVGDVLRALAVQIDADMDKRAAELAMRGIRGN